MSVPALLVCSGAASAPETFCVDALPGRASSPRSPEYAWRNVNPVDFPITRATSNETSAPATLAFELPCGFRERLVAFSRKAQADVYVPVLSVFAVFVQRYSSQDDFIIAFYDGVRASPALLRFDLTGDMRFDDLLTLARHGRCKSDDESAQADFYRVSFVADRGAAEEDATLEPGCLLRLSFHGSPSRLSTHFTYDSSFFSAEMISRMAGHFRNLAEAAIGAPSSEISRLSIFLPDELRRILVDWNGPHEASAPRSIPQELEARANEAPYFPALRYEGETLTRDALNARANRLAWYLIRRGLGGGAFVGICLDDPLEAVVAIIGVLKTGAAYVPLSFSSPMERLQETVADAQMRFLITTSLLQSWRPLGSVEVILLDRLASALALEESRNPVVDSQPDDAAYVIYTSGSSGAPKGVVGLHRTVTSSRHWAVPLETDDVYALNSSLCFGSSVLALFFPLICGVPVVVVPDERYRDTRQLSLAIEAAGITRIALVPPQLRQLINLGPDVTARMQGIRTVISAGGILLPDTVAKFRASLPHARLINAYSCTEMGTIATRRIVTRSVDANPRSIGRPVVNTRVYILDRHLNPAPIGVAGELCIGSADMPRGYLHRPEATAERFITDPFLSNETVSETGTLLFHTGDYARYLPDGEIEFIGREDHQVKIRGIRIELQEIEAVLESHPGVAEAVVEPQETGDDKRLIAWVVWRKNEAASVGKLRDFISQRLPAYMVPARFVFLRELPRTPNGKVDRRALSAPARRPEMDEPFEAPRNVLERSLAEIWAEALSLDEAGIHDPFLALGGDSLSMTRIISAVLERHRVDIPAEAFFERSTIAEQAEDYFGFEEHGRGDKEVAWTWHGGVSEKEPG